jgi:hypothetical protein
VAVPTSKINPIFPRLLICEGSDDFFFFQHLIEEWKLPRFHIQHSGGRDPRGGISKFGAAIRAFRTQRTHIYKQLKNIVIVADNDDSPQENFEYVCKQIESVFGYGTAPTAPLDKSNTNPPVTVLMIPGTGVEGHLEKLCQETARNADKNIAKSVDDFMALIHSDKWPSESRKAKAWLRTNLAARCENDPFVSLGEVFSESRYKKLIPLNHNSFDQIIDFLKSFP